MMARISGLLIGLSMVVIAVSGGVLAQAAFGVDLALSIGCALLFLLVLVLTADRNARARERLALEQRIEAVEYDLEYLMGRLGAPAAPAPSIAKQAPQRPRSEEAAAKRPAPAPRTEPDSKAVKTPVEREHPARVEPTLAQHAPEPIEPARTDTVGLAEAPVRADQGEAAEADPLPTLAPAPKVAAPVERPSPAAPRRSVAVEVLTEPDPERSREEAVPAQRGPSAARVAAAIDQDRLEYALQSVVALPQRRPRWYELTTRLRVDGGPALEPADWIEAARAAGRLAALDRLVLSRAEPVLRRIRAGGNDVGLFCNISAELLADSTAFRNLFSLLDAGPELKGALVLEISQGAVKTLGAVEIEAIRVLAERGVRLSLDEVTDLSLDFGELSAHGFHVLKIPARILLRDFAAAGADIHPADFSDLLARFGIDLVVTDVEDEATVVSLLDYGIKFAQGDVFSPARAIRAEAFAQRGPRQATG